MHTPTHNYTLGEMTDLFRATGDLQAVSDTIVTAVLAAESGNQPQQQQQQQQQ